MIPLMRRRLLTLLLLLQTVGCNTVGPIEFSPRGQVRRISSADLVKPVKLELNLPPIKDSSVIAVDRQCLVGRWRETVHVVDQIVDRQKMTEERKMSTFTYNYDLREDGTFVQDKVLGGTWMLAGDVLTLDYSGNYRDEFYRVMRRGDDEMIWHFTEDEMEERVKANRTGNTRGYARNCSGRIDGDGCCRIVVDLPYATTGVLRFTETIVASPGVLRRIGSRSVRKLDPLAVERKKNLDSLLKAGVITEEEYKKEIEKETK